jgi:hypothetical protein
MVKIVFILLLVGGAAYLIQDWAASNPLKPEIGPREVVIHADRLVVSFDRLGQEKRSYMVFGGTKAEPTNTLSNVTLATISIERAKAMRASYPDFHRSNSDGASRAMRMVQTTSFIAADGKARKALRKTVDRHEKGVARAGDRACVTVSGNRLSLSEIKLADSGNAKIRTPKTEFFLATQVENVDCLELLGVRH